MVDFLFGSKSKVITPEPKVTQEPKATTEQQALLKQLIGSLSGGTVGDTALAPVSIPSFEPPGGRFVPGATETELGSLDDIINLSKTYSEGGAAFEALSKALSGTPQDFEEFYKTNVKDPSLETFQEDVLPALSRRFSGNLFGSQRREAEVEATEDLTKVLTRERAKLAFDTQQAAADRALKALGLIPSAITGATTALGAAGLPRTLETREIAAESTAFDKEIALQQQRINNILRALGLQTVENIASTPVVVPGGQGLIPSVLAASAPAIAKAVVK